LVSHGTNGKILYAARNGASRDAFAITDAELDDLLDFHLLEQVGGRLRTAFPVVGSTETSALRAHLRDQVAPLAAVIEGPTRVMTAELERRKLSSGYALVFGYALDLLLWEPLNMAGAVPDTALTPERPWWNGAFWAIYPPRERSSGTNFLDCGEGITLVTVWSDETARGLRAFEDSPGVREALLGLTRPGTMLGSADATSTSEKWRLRRRDGQSALALVGTGDDLDDLAHQLAEPVADLLVSGKLDGARAMIPTPKRDVATVVVAHELIWELTDQLIERGACRLPPALGNLTARMFLLAENSNFDDQ
jgi:hypothetical protein